MVEGFYRQVTERLHDVGYVRINGGKGSHEKWRNPTTGHVVTVPRNLYSRHTANEILKDVGLPKQF